MKMLKKIKTDMWISVLMMFLIGILFVVRPQDSLEITAIIAGVIIFVNVSMTWFIIRERG